MSTQIIDSSIIEGQLRARGINIPHKKPCCGRGPAPVKYARYLKQLGYTGNVAIRTRGVISEIVNL